MHTMTDKKDLSQALKKSFDYCDAALVGMTDQKALTAVSVNGKQVYPVQGMVSLVSSDNEHYGNMVGYLRSQGIVPPSIARAKK
jgi:phage gp46-like protein